MLMARTSLLDISYRDDGPQIGYVVILLHGWSVDFSTWNAIISRLNEVLVGQPLAALPGNGQLLSISI